MNTYFPLPLDRGLDVFDWCAQILHHYVNTWALKSRIHKGFDGHNVKFGGFIP